MSDKKTTNKTISEEDRFARAYEIAGQAIDALLEQDQANHPQPSVACRLTNDGNGVIEVGGAPHNVSYQTNPPVNAIVFSAGGDPTRPGSHQPPPRTSVRVPLKHHGKDDTQ